MVIDNSASSLNPAPTLRYDSTRLYAGEYLPWSIYQQNPQGEFPLKSVLLDNYSSVLENLSCSVSEMRDLLLHFGVYASSGTDERPNLRRGSCVSAPKGEVYALGNYLNYRYDFADGGMITGQQQIFDLVRSIVGQTRMIVNFGIMTIGQNGKGGEVVFPIGDLTDDADYTDFLARVPGSGLPLATKALRTKVALPLSEVLVDADAYLRGTQLPVSGRKEPAPPDTVAVGYNHIIVLSTDLPRGENISLLEAQIGDADQDGTHEQSYGQGSDYLDDVAAALYLGPNRVMTSTLVLGMDYDPLMYATAHNGHGRWYAIGSVRSSDIARDLSKIVMPLCLVESAEYPQPLP